ncbi:hypothetical protein HUT18_21050 [Streptomyces sp. NA04227]|uniref:hypothetical protein n=1 Tax=Streptomyces sp. NA04227 TaxID=2742136 RepID=UPI001591F113|nr:hypothetical protein [Streptomyces sp. NA04227]QKW08485.1 hypothetical protein HUT18_21050 [Streptomyces sp. NA04227]
MLTLHLAEASQLAVLVEGQYVAAVGSGEETAAARPGVRVRRWPGILLPGLVNPHGPELLERTYHPDPREADTLGTAPLTGDRAAALLTDPSHRAATARRGVQRMLAHGTVAVAGTLRGPALDAVRRAGLAQLPRTGTPGGTPALDPYASGVPLPVLPPLAVGDVARFAVFDVADEAELAVRGAGTCVATVVAGRLVYRRR